MRISAKQVDADDITKTGDESIQDLGDVKIFCSNCKKQVAQLKLLVQDDTIESNIVAKCPYCEDKSFVQQVYGRFAIIEMDDLKLSDFPMTVEKVGDKTIQNVTIISRRK